MLTARLSANGTPQFADPAISNPVQRYELLRFKTVIRLPPSFNFATFSKVAPVRARNLITRGSDFRRKAGASATDSVLQLQKRFGNAVGVFSLNL